MRFLKTSQVLFLQVNFKIWRCRYFACTFGENFLRLMSQILLFLITGLFAAMLFLNVYFRAKVMKTYKKLVQNRVQFGAAHIFSKAKMEKEILPEYPEMQDDIRSFVNHIQYSIKMAVVLIVLITLSGAVLMYYG
jgi:hypothetical protein